MNNTHEYYEMLVSRYKDNDLNDEETAEMEEHLHECAECRKFKEEVFAMSSILTGKMPIEVNNTKKKFKFVPYIASIAAMLLIFVGVGIVINNNNNNTASIDSPMVASTTTLEKQEENVYSDYDDYTLLSTYFDYAPDNQSSEEDSVILSAYMAYME